MSLSESNDQAEVWIVSGHHLLRHSLEGLLTEKSFAVRSFRNLDQIRDGDIQGSDPRVLLLEPEAGLPIVDQVRECQELDLGAALVLVLRSSSDIDLGSAIRAGAAGCVTHETPPEVIGGLIELILGGFIVWPRSAPEEIGFARRATDLQSRTNRRHPADLEQKLELLSRREKEVMGLVARGLGNKRIATALQISDTTVRLHMRSIIRKLGVENRSQVVIYALHV